MFGVARIIHKITADGKSCDTLFLNKIDKGIHLVVKQTLWLFFGLLSLMFGIVGVVLPLLPTTPFVLLAAFCFSKGSTRLHTWLLEHRLFGQLIADWQQYGVISFRAKLIATFSMVLMISYPLIYLPFALWLKIAVSIVMLLVLLFICTRPSSH